MADFSVSTAFTALDKTTKVLKQIANKAKPVVGGMAKSFKAMSATAVRSFKVAGQKISGILNKLQRKTAMFGKGFTGALKTGVAVAGIASVTLAMQAGITTGLEFQQTIVNASAKLGALAAPGTEAFRNIEKAAKDVGATTEFTASQAAEGLNFLALAGFNAEQSIAALPQVVDLATAAQIDLARASDIATDTLGAMGLKTKDAAQQSLNLARVNDVLAKTTTTANTNMEQLFESMVEGGPIAIAAGSSIEQFAALAGKLADAGIKGSKAGTTLKNVFVRLSAKAPEAAKALSSLGIKTKDASGNLRDVTRILDDINAATSKLGGAEKTEALFKIFGKIPLAGVNILLQEGGESLRAYQAELENAGGANAEMAAIMRSTSLAAVKTLKSAIEGLGLTIFDQIRPAFTDAVKGLTAFVGGWAFFLKMHPGIVGLLVTIAKIAAPVLAITLAIVGLNLAIAAFNVIMAANPIGLIVIGIVAAVAAIVILRKQLLAVGAVIVGVLIAPMLGFLKLIAMIPGLGFLGEASDAVAGAIRGAITGGFGGEEPEAMATGGKVKSPQATTARQFNETRNRVIIEDGTGRARQAEDNAPGIVSIIPRTGGSGFDEGFAGA